ncbi:glycosyltransferase family 9 protein [bacterium]|nr:glycosyltransferase family 9 protein [bacterium]
MPRALILKPSSLGDIVHSLPVAAALASDGFEVHFSSRREYRPLLEMSPSVFTVLDFPSAWTDVPHFVRDLRARDYDAVIDLQGLLRSGLAAAFARTDTRVGLPDSREGSMFFYNVVARYPEGTRHAVDRYWSVLSSLSVAASGKVFPLNIPAASVREARALTGEGAYLVFSPTSRQARKLWPPERWVELADRARRAAKRVVVVGRLGESDGCRPESWRTAPWVDLINRTSLPVLCAVLAASKACITVDSAPMHLAAALGVPVVALFGPTDPEKVGPYTERRRIVRAGAMGEISADGVWEVLEEATSL